MVADAESDSHLEIAHVLFTDIVGYSKQLTSEQRELFHLLNEVVCNTRQFQKAESAGKLVRLPTGDGMALAFFTNVDAPVRCACEISRQLRERPQLTLRMGINSGPVEEVTDVNGRRNVTGAGINLAQRVMDCGDGGHILLSKRVADDLAQYTDWQPRLHDLGEVEVKHGVRVKVTNLYGDGFGNSVTPEKIKRAEQDRVREATLARTRNHRRIVTIVSGALLLLTAIGIATWVWERRAALTSAYKTGVAGIVEKSVAVLPFENFGDKDNAYLADGVQDDILTDLAKVADLKVISRRSVSQYRGSTQSIRDIGRALQVAYVLEGTVRKVADQVRVTTQLIDTRTEAEKWGEKYERDVADVFAIQNQISQAIVAQLKATLSPTEKSALEARPTQDQQAYDLYLRARALIRQGPAMTVKMGQADVPRAITLLETAVARDPNFFLAYCLLSEAQLMLFGLEYYNYERLPKAKAAAEAALRINPQSGEAHLALAQYFYVGLHDRDASASDLAVAAGSLPGNVSVLSLSADIAAEKGRWSKALQDRTKVFQLDPRDGDAAFSLVELQIALRRYADAEKVIEQVMAFMPQQSTGPFCTLKGRIALARGDTKGAMAAYDAHPRRNAGSMSVNLSVANGFFLERQYGKATEILLSADEVARQHDALPQGGDNPAARGGVYFQLGTIARILGETTKARGYFEEAGENSRAWLEKNPQQGSIYEARAAARIAADEAALGRKEEAMRQAQHVLELWPTTRNAVVAADVAPLLATAYMWAGQNETALQVLEQFAKFPYGPTAGELKLNPVWDDLRSDPRFQKIVTKAAEPIAIE